MKHPDNAEVRIIPNTLRMNRSAIWVGRLLLGIAPVINASKTSSMDEGSPEKCRMATDSKRVIPVKRRTIFY